MKEKQTKANVIFSLLQIKGSQEVSKKSLLMIHNSKDVGLGLRKLGFKSHIRHGNLPCFWASYDLSAFPFPNKVLVRLFTIFKKKLRVFLGPMLGLS